MPVSLQTKQTRPVTKERTPSASPSLGGHSMYHLPGPQVDYRLAAPTPDFTNPSCRAFLPSHDRAKPALTGPRIPSVTRPSARLPQTTSPVGLIVCPGPQAPPAPLGRSPAPQPRSPAFLCPRWGARPPLWLSHPPRSPPRRAVRSRRPQTLPTPTSAPQGAPTPRPRRLGRYRAHSLGPRP